MASHPLPVAQATLAVHGEVLTPRSFSREDLARLPGQILDLEARIPGRKGRAGRQPRATAW